MTFLRLAPAATLLLVAFFASAPPAAAQTPAPKPDARLGERIYREGVLPGGKTLRATVQGDVPVEGAQLNCAGCHRRSGFGSSEGAAFVPPVTGPTLYREKDPRAADLFRRLFQEVQPAHFRARVRDPRARPAYTDETLADALRRGVDSSGRALDPLMPRYRLSEEEAGHLVAYLKTLSAAAPPGVSDSEIHFATVLTEGVTHDERRALLDVMRAYFRWKNADTRAMLRRSDERAWYQQSWKDTYREWVLHVWELKGAPETWPAQLEAFYRARPVFAVLGGAGEGDWRPVHDFCEREGVPCLFPNTSRPVVSGANAYTLYLSKGLTVEAEALARHLRETNADAHVIQVYRSAEGFLLAYTFERAMERLGAPGVWQEPVPADEKLTPAFWNSLLEGERPTALVLWLDGEDAETLGAAPNFAGAVGRIYLSYGLMKETLPQALAGLGDKVHLTYPYALPQEESPHAYRVRAWLRARGVEPAHGRLQLNTHFALSVADHALMTTAGSFSRDYFVETVEQETESAPSPGVFPRLSLGPGQRFASKGSYVVKLSGDRFQPATGWIVP